MGAFGWLMTDTGMSNARADAVVSLGFVCSRGGGDGFVFFPDVSVVDIAFGCARCAVFTGGLLPATDDAAPGFDFTSTTKIASSPIIGA